MLELAAKAVGLEIIKHSQEARDKAGYECVGLYVKDQKSICVSTGWNPLAKDGDALRLAVSCYMTICADGVATVSACVGYGRDRVMATQTISECGNDKNAATRRAIVRAAAEIGKGMQS